MKRLIAYSSVSHLGFCMLGLFALNPLGIQGGTLQMINHGLSTGGLFACVGMIYERYHTREIRQFGGLARRLPILAFFMLIFALSSIGLPGLNGFVGELLLLVGMFQRAWTDPPLQWALQYRVIAVAAVLGVVLGAWYMLWLIERVFFGPLKEPVDHDDQAAVADLSFREVAALAPLVVFVVWIGVAPRTFLDPMAPALERLAMQVDDAYTHQYATREGTRARLQYGVTAAGLAGQAPAFWRVSPPPIPPPAPPHDFADLSQSEMASSCAATWRGGGHAMGCEPSHAGTGLMLVRRGNAAR